MSDFKSATTQNNRRDGTRLSRQRSPRNRTRDNRKTCNLFRIIRLFLKELDAFSVEVTIFLFFLTETRANRRQQQNNKLILVCSLYQRGWYKSSITYHICDYSIQVFCIFFFYPIDGPIKLYYFHIF